jgi:phosphoribosyl 1,2-cyclic phosphodiesterase
MSIFCPLASGSKGNALLLGTAQTKVLIDVGLNVKQLKERLAQLNISLEEIDAVVITHEHGDHIRGLEVLCKQMHIPVLANSDTAKAICETMPIVPNFKIFATGEHFTFGDMVFHPFSVQHDTADPVAFTVRVGETKIGICTDLGFVTSLVKSHLKECHTLYIESNHEPSMVYASSRPLVYKQRVLGRQGHLSNQSCADLLKEIYHKDLKRIYLAHLSQECNHPQVALNFSKESLKPYLEELIITIAYQDKVSEPIYF